MGNSCVLVSEWDIRPIDVTCQSPSYTKAMTKWSVGDVRSLMNHWYPPESAHGWDKVGLITGGPQAQVDRILLALDPTQAVVQEALQWGANMIITHHPLLLRGASFLNQESAKGESSPRSIAMKLRFLMLIPMATSHKMALHRPVRRHWS